MGVMISVDTCGVWVLLEAEVLDVEVVEAAADDVYVAWSNESPVDLLPPVRIPPLPLPLPRPRPRPRPKNAASSASSMVPTAS